MDKNEFYRNRIIWKANQHNVFNEAQLYHDDIPNDCKRIVNEVLPSDSNINPVLLFWGGPLKWTLLGEQEICSFYSGKIHCYDLDCIDKKITLYHSGKTPETNKKRDAEFIRLEKCEGLVWAPSGKLLFALMSILKMFPLRYQK